MLEVHGKQTSINVRKVLWACAELGVEWTAGDETLLQSNPNRLAPVIDDGGFVLWESNTIIRYLAGRYGGGHLLPADPRARANIEKWIDWQATDFNASWAYAFQALARQNPAFDDQVQIGQSLTAWTGCMDIVEQQLGKTGAFIAGPDFTLADIPIGLSVNRWFMTPGTGSGHAAAKAYYDRLGERAGYQTYGRNGVP